MRRETMVRRPAFARHVAMALTLEHPSQTQLYWYNDDLMTSTTSSTTRRSIPPNWSRPRAWNAPHRAFLSVIDQVNEMTLAEVRAPTMF